MNRLRTSLAYTFFLFVISIMISQSAMDGFGSIAALLLLAYWFQQKKSFQLFPNTGMGVPFLLFSLAVLASFLFNLQHQTLFLYRAVELKWILHFYFIVSTLLVLNPDWKAVEKVQIFVAISAFFALLAPVLGYDILRGANSEIDRTSTGIARAGGFFSNPMTFSHLHAMFFFLLIGLSIHLMLAKDKHRYRTVALMLLMGLAVFLSFTRGVWMGVFVGLAATGFAVNRRWGIVVLLACLIFGVLAVAFVPSIQDRALQAFNPAESYDSERLWIWKANWEIFKDHPFFGVGYGENAELLREYYPKIGAPSGLLISHAHNEYLHLLAGLGIFGLSAYIFMLYSFLRATLRAYSKSIQNKFPTWIQGLVLGSFGAQISFIVGSLTESAFEHSKVRYALMLVWSLPLWVHLTKPEKFKLKEDRVARE